ncbi:MAG: hypothetical protein JNM63_01240 [Spirochaetia bacterium]|nr:hypothetical protein [Spirochaetia bacterium]
MKEKHAAFRDRKNPRIFWNNDGDDLRMVAFGEGEIWSPEGMIPLVERFSSVEEFLNLRLAALRGTSVDTVSYCGVFTWPVWDYPKERIRVLGPDPLKPAIDFVHGLGKDFFFNIRMNDCHVSGPHWQGPLWWEPFRLRHRECLQSVIPEIEWRRDYLPWALGKSKRFPLKNILDRQGAGSREVYSWATYDYARVEVRDYFLGLIGEALERYELDGIDLDWLRSPCFFRMGEARAHVPLMNDFVRRAAALIRAASKKRKTPVACCMRVPDSPARALELGLDVAHWVREGWVDHLIAGNGLSNFSMPFEPWKKICRPHGVSVHACLSRSAHAHGDPSVFSGACHRSWKEGVDGLYFFNHFIPGEYERMNVAAQPEKLNLAGKAYALDRQGGVFENGTAHEGPLPMIFTGCSGPTQADFEMAIPQRVPKKTRPRLKVRWRGIGNGERARWWVNGKPAARQKSGADGCLVYEVPSLGAGSNSLKLEIDAEGLKGKELVLESVSISFPGGP